MWPSSRRLNASAVHISGAAAGTSPLVPAPSHDDSPPPRSDTDELLDAGCAAVITGACAAAGTRTASTTTAVGDGEESTSAADADSMVAAASASFEPGGDGAEAEPAGAGLPDPDRIGEGAESAEGDVADSASGAEWRWREVFPESVDPPESAGTSVETAPVGPAAGRPASGIPPCTGRDGPPDPEDASVGDLLTEDRGVEDADGEPEASEPVDPAEPVVSANATGTDATAEPTPNATANAPTRPTHRA